MYLWLKSGQRFQPVYNEVLMDARSVKHWMSLSLRDGQWFQAVYNGVLIQQQV